MLIALMMEAVSASETSVNCCHTTRRNIPEDSHLHVNAWSITRQHIVSASYCTQTLLLPVTAQKHCYCQLLHKDIVTASYCTKTLLLPVTAQRHYYCKLLHKDIVTTSYCTKTLLLQVTAQRHCYYKLLHKDIVTASCCIKTLLRSLNYQTSLQTGHKRTEQCHINLPVKTNLLSANLEF
jgi:hypothetical protein